MLPALPATTHDADNDWTQDLSEAEKELLAVRHVEFGQQCVVVVVLIKPLVKRVVADLQSTVVSDVLTKRRYSVQLLNQHTWYKLTSGYVGLRWT